MNCQDLVRIGVAALALAVVTAGAPAQAQTVPVVSRAALGGNDSIDWSAVGADGDVLSNPFAVTSNGGLNVTVSKTADPDPALDYFLRADQGATWGGAFDPGDPLLWTLTSTGPITLTFADPILGIGLQLQNAWDDPSGNPFDAMIEAFDSANVSLGSSSLTQVNGAPFLGLLGPTANISKVVISSADAAFNDPNFAINGVDLVRSAGANVAPEPGSLALFLPGLSVLGLARLKKRAGKPRASA